MPQANDHVAVQQMGSPGVTRPSIAPRDLCEHPLITGNTPAAEAEWFVKRVFGKRRPKLEYLRFPLTEAIVDAAHAGMGIAVLSEWIASTYLGSGELVAQRLASDPLRRPWRIAFRPDAADIARRLASALEGAPPLVYAGSSGTEGRARARTPGRATS
jgi:LysR family transcriptional regulator for metE and metH